MISPTWFFGGRAFRELTSQSLLLISEFWSNVSRAILYGLKQSFEISSRDLCSTIGSEANYHIYYKNIE